MKLNVRQAARLLSVSESEVYRWVEEGEIPCVLVKNQPLFGRAELLEWATARRLPVSFELFENGDDGGSRLRIADALEHGGVHYDVPGADRASVLKAIVERLPLSEDDDRDLLLQVLLALATLVGSAVIALAANRRPRVAAGAAALGAVVAALVGLAPALDSLRTGATATMTGPWTLPTGAVQLGLDPLTAFFLPPLL